MCNADVAALPDNSLSEAASRLIPVLADMDTIRSGFENLGFHDASIDAIVREPGRIAVEFSGAYLSKVHPSSYGSDWRIESGTLIFTGVTGEETVFWCGKWSLRSSSRTGVAIGRGHAGLI